MIQQGKGIISIKDEYLLEFNTLLTEFYNTNEDSDIIKFIYDKCIIGIE